MNDRLLSAVVEKFPRKFLELCRIVVDECKRRDVCKNKTEDHPRETEVFTRLHFRKNMNLHCEDSRF